jgi:hypothetical protein
MGVREMRMLDVSDCVTDVKHALTLLGKAKHARKGPCLPRLKTREPKTMSLVQGYTAALERD